MTKAVECKKF